MESLQIRSDRTQKMAWFVKAGNTQGLPEYMDCIYVRLYKLSKKMTTPSALSSYLKARYKMTCEVFWVCFGFKTDCVLMQVTAAGILMLCDSFSFLLSGKKQALVFQGSRCKFKMSLARRWTKCWIIYLLFGLVKLEDCITEHQFSPRFSFSLWTFLCQLLCAEAMNAVSKFMPHLKIIL